MPSRSDRRARLRRHLQEHRLESGIEWSDAVTGFNSSIAEGWQAGPGAWGCLQSHLKILRQALADGVESVLILEDDVVFSKHTLRCLPILMAGLPPDWGQFYLGGQHLRDPSATSSPVIWSANNVNRTHAWAAHRQHLPRIIEHLTRLRDGAHPTGGSGAWHIDHQLGSAHEQSLWPCYTPSWWLAGQEADQSDICGQQLPRRWWHHRRYARSLPMVHLGEEHAASNPGWIFTIGEDEKFDAILTRNGLLLAWLHHLAQLALDRGCLPAWHPGKLPAERVAELWPAGVAVNSDAALNDYPFNGLFTHSLVEALQASA